MSVCDYRKFGDIEALSFAKFSAPSLRHAVFSRKGGVSTAPYDYLNVGLNVGDDPENVYENRARVKKALGLAALVSAQQVHGVEVMTVAGPVVEDVEFPGYDALITDLPGVGLMVQQADCQAVMLFDPARKVIGIVHAGWRGSRANIIQKTISSMNKAFGTIPEDLQAAVSPSLGPCCAEFVNYRQELPAHFQSYQLRPNYFDFWAISRDQLLACGVKADNIEIAGVCTVCDKNFFSYRRERNTGRFGTVIALR